MNNVLHFSDAASLGFHTAVLLACEPECAVKVKDAAALLKVSEAHLSKVMQRMAKAGLVRAERGPKGGYRLEPNPETVTLLDVLEAIDGPLVDHNCLFGAPVCAGGDCVLGDLPRRVNGQIREYLSETRLSQLTGVFEGLSVDSAV